MVPWVRYVLPWQSSESEVFFFSFFSRYKVLLPFVPKSCPLNYSIHIELTSTIANYDFSTRFEFFLFSNAFRQ